MCTYNEDVYSVGESWLVDECTQCTCMDDRQVLCSVTICELTSISYCSNSPLDSFFTACCPICHSQSLSSSSSSSSVTVSLSSSVTVSLSHHHHHHLSLTLTFSLLHLSHHCVCCYFCINILTFPEKCGGGVRVCFQPPMSHSFIQNCCCITLQVSHHKE